MALNKDLEVVTVVVVMLLCIGIFTESAQATTCMNRGIRIDDFGVVGKNMNDAEVFSIGKDTIKLSGNIVSLVDRPITVNLGISSEEGIGSGFIHQACILEKDLFKTFGNDGMHFEIVSEESKTVHLQPYEIIPLEMELRPLKSGLYNLRIVLDTLTIDQDSPYFQTSTTENQIQVIGKDMLTTNDIMSQILIGIIMSIQIAAVMILGVVLFKKIKFTKFRVWFGLG